MSNSSNDAFLYVLDPVTFSGSRGWLPLQSVANATDGQGADASLPAFPVVSFSYGFNGVSWDRLRSFATNANGVPVGTTGILGAASFLFTFNGTTWDRLRSVVTTTDGLVLPSNGAVSVMNGALGFNGTAWDRARTLSAVNVALAAQIGVQAIAPCGNWSITHTPAVNTQATISRAAVAAQRHVCTSIKAKLLAPAATLSGVVQINLRDGATGAGTILWSETMQVGGAGSITVDRDQVTLSGLSIFGSANTQMTLEFSAAGGAGTFESVSLTGYTVA